MVFIERKEFQDIINNTRFNSPYWIPMDRLVLSALQIFTSRYVNPQDREVCRLLLKVGAGIGKTLTSVKSFMAFLTIFRHIFSRSQEARYISIIGYSRQVFIRELLKYPELEIITYDELYKIRSYEQKIYSSVGANKEYFKAELSAFRQKIKKRISTELLGGMFRFYGLKQLLNQLFVGGLPEDAMQSNVYELYKQGRVKVNEILLGKFKGGCIIVDEIHQFYNSKEINNFGLALQFLLEYYGRDITMIGLSATILNNKAREIIDIANIMREPETPLFKTEDFFTNDKPTSSLEPLYKAFWGKVIFLEESTADYPELKYMGDSIRGIDYLKFTLCPMSPLHQQTFLLDGLDENTSKNFIIHDMVLPNPDIPLDDLKLFHPDVYYNLSPSEKSRISHYKGLYDSDAAKKIIKAAPNEWKRAVGIDIKELSNKEYTFVGPFWKYENLKTYSTKKCKLLELLNTELTLNPRQKVLDYHTYVKGSGISATGEMLKWNGYINYTDIPKSETYSSDEHITQEEWVKKYPDKEYHPARMVTLDAEVSNKNKDEYIDEYNKASNKYGQNIQLFNGSQKIKQSVDFRQVQLQFIEHRPTNISEYIQIKGRSVRRGAAEGLPPNMQNVKLYTLCSTYSSPTNLQPDLSRDTLEMRKYRNKVAEFKLIQEIEYELNRTSCNSYIFNKNGFKQSDILGAKSFIPLPTTIDGPYTGTPTITDITYFSHGYYTYTINEFTNVIKRAFISNSVWTYDSLWEFCCEIKMSNIDLSQSKDIFNIALKKLIFIPGQSLINMKNIIIFDNENYIIDKYYINGAASRMPRKVIVEIDKYYVLTVVDSFGNVQLGPDCFLTRTQKKIFNVFLLNESKLKLSQNYIKKITKKAKEIDPDQREVFYYTFLMAFPKETHYYVLQDIIENKYGAKKVDKLPKKYIDTYKKIGVLGKNWYIDQNKKNIFENGKWESYALPPDNRPDNDIVIGLIDNELFKLKKPILTEYHVRDRRTIERGMVCSSYAKEDLGKLIVDLHAIMPSRLSTQSACAQILIRLVELEGESSKSENPKKYLLFNK